jgi:hypothetical protein
MKFPFTAISSTNPMCLLIVISAAVWLVTACAQKTQAQEAGKIREVNVGGYLLTSVSQAPTSFNAGYSFYTEVWPLTEKYQGHRFQSGLFGTWLSSQYNGPAPEHLYSDIEGGLGWWTDTRFPTETPKFIMGGVGPNFSYIANGPAHGAGDWKNPRGLYGVAQLSPWLLFPIDGLNIRQGACDQLFGYGYLTLPLLPAKTTTDGVDVPTGDNCWTLFLNTKNFKGPVAFFTPYFWSHSTVTNPQWAGKLLDSRPGQPNKPFQMETQYIPAAVSEDARGESYLRTAVTQFPLDKDGSTVLIHHLTVYNKDALWNEMKRWFNGGAAVSGSINPMGAELQKINGGGAEWKIWPPKQGEEPVPLAFRSFATPFTPDPLTFGFRWSSQLARTKTVHGALVRLPEYYHLTTDANNKPVWTPVAQDTVPADTKLASLNFDRPSEPVEEPYTTPDEPNSCWKKPGPVAGPFKARLGDGSVVTYYWYRFADQPALLNAGLTNAEREQLQKRVENIQRLWTKNRNYIAPPAEGTLCDLDPALLVTPPKGKEVGYVPIATRQEWGGLATKRHGH